MTDEQIRKIASELAYDVAQCKNNTLMHKNCFPFEHSEQALLSVAKQVREETIKQCARKLKDGIYFQCNPEAMTITLYEFNRISKEYLDRINNMLVSHLSPSERNEEEKRNV